MNQYYTVFAGCSFTEGIGLPNTKCNPNLWVNLLYHSSNELLKTNLLNLGIGGSSNIEIFQQSINALSRYKCKYLFVSWTSLYRYQFSLGVELYDVGQYWAPTAELNDVSVNPGLTYNKKFLNNIKNKFFALHHDHYELVKVLKYTATINQLCKQLGTKVYFINSILPWDIGYFEVVSSSTRMPSDTTPYTQKLLNKDTRDDLEFFKIYDIIHQEYANTAGLHECNWLNIDQGFRSHFLIDVGNDGSHPGVESHRQFSKYLIGNFNHKQQTDNYVT